MPVKATEKQISDFLQDFNNESLENEPKPNKRQTKNKENNMSEKIELTVEQQIEQAIAKARREDELKQAQREENKVYLGCKVMSKRVREGSPIVDKDTRQQKMVNGVPQKYDDKYYATLVFMGAELETEVSKENYEMLEEMKTYYCEGYIGEVKVFGTSVVQPIFRKYTQI